MPAPHGAGRWRGAGEGLSAVSTGGGSGPRGCVQHGGGRRVRALVPLSVPAFGKRLHQQALCRSPCACVRQPAAGCSFFGFVSALVYLEAAVRLASCRRAERCVPTGFWSEPVIKCGCCKNSQAKISRLKIHLRCRQTAIWEKESHLERHKQIKLLVLEVR